MEFTGERYVPALRGEIRLEHLHRYAFCLPYCRGKRVLDLACGEGYGSAMIASVAKSVVGVDASDEAVRNATAQYGCVSSQLEFRQGDASSLEFPDRTFDVVVSFETIEHLLAQEEMLKEIARVLTSGGLMILSSPDKKTYSDQTGLHNEFHVRELYRDELESLVSRHFKRFRLLGQTLAGGSAIAPLGDADTAGIHAAAVLADEGNRPVPGMPAFANPVYLLVLATNGRQLAPARPSILLSDSDDPLRELKRVAKWASGVHEEMEALRHSSSERIDALQTELISVRDAASREVEVTLAAANDARREADLKIERLGASIVKLEREGAERLERVRRVADGHRTQLAAVRAQLLSAVNESGELRNRLRIVQSELDAERLARAADERTASIALATAQEAAADAILERDRCIDGIALQLDATRRDADRAQIVNQQEIRSLSEQLEEAAGRIKQGDQAFFETTKRLEFETSRVGELEREVSLLARQLTEVQGDRLRLEGELHELTTRSAAEIARVHDQLAIQACSASQCREDLEAKCSLLSRQLVEMRARAESAAQRCRDVTEAHRLEMASMRTEMASRMTSAVGEAHAAATMEAERRTASWMAERDTLLRANAELIKQAARAEERANQARIRYTEESTALAAKWQSRYRTAVDDASSRLARFKVDSRAIVESYRTVNRALHERYAAEIQSREAAVNASRSELARVTTTAHRAVAQLESARRRRTDEAAAQLSEWKAVAFNAVRALACDYEIGRLRADWSIGMTNGDPPVGHAIVNTIRLMLHSAMTRMEVVLQGRPGLRDAVLLYPDSEFVAWAYRSVLGREADPDGHRAYTSRIALGASRLSVLADMCRSAEARGRPHVPDPAMTEILKTVPARRAFVLKAQVAERLEALLRMPNPGSDLSADPLVGLYSAAPCGGLVPDEVVATVGIQLGLLPNTPEDLDVFKAAADLMCVAAEPEFVDRCHQIINRRQPDAEERASAVETLRLPHGRLRLIEELAATRWRTVSEQALTRTELESVIVTGASLMRLSSCSRPEVSLVVAVNESFEDLVPCLRSIALQPPAVPFEVIVVGDPGSEHPDLLLECHGVRIVPCPASASAAQRIDIGVAASTGEWIHLIDAREAFGPGTTAELLEELSADPSAGMVTSPARSRGGSYSDTRDRGTAIESAMLPRYLYPVRRSPAEGIESFSDLAGALADHLRGCGYTLGHSVADRATARGSSAESSGRLVADPAIAHSERH
jgi:SAM-dependent methyltransferase